MGAMMLPTRTVCLALVLMLLQACSQERNPTSLPGSHPPEWIVATSPDFHGKVATATGLGGCEQCHGADLRGGVSEISCIDCHFESGACASCHGGLDNFTGAPPYGLHGEIDDTTLAVGAHTPHLEGSTEAAAVPCETCHLVPVAILDPDHLDRSGVDSIAEITWQGLGAIGDPVWDRESRTCVDTYCHGNFDGGNPNNVPIWTAPGQATCGSCHDDGNSPATLGGIHSIHVTAFSLDCADCHAAVVDPIFNILDPTLHVNGSVDFQIRDQAVCDRCHTVNAASCTDCHGGDDNQTGAPPLGLRGETNAQFRAVGAHTTHVEGSYISDPFDCNECHLVPATVADSGHIDLDSIAEIVWGPTAGAASVWDRGLRTCADTYCHGNFDGGYTSNAPVWTAPGQATCGSCHDDGSNPDQLSGKHKKHVADENLQCEECHATVVVGNDIIVGKPLHVNGEKDISFANVQVTFENSRCTNNDCHGDKNW